MKKDNFNILITALFLLLFSVNQCFAANMYWFSDLTGGGTGALDKVDGSSLNDGDAAFVVTSTFDLHVYVLDDDSAAAESSPTVISPDSNAGDKRWIKLELDGEYIEDDTVDDDAIDFTDITLADFGLVATHDTASELDALYEGELNNLAGLAAALSDVGDYMSTLLGSTVDNEATFKAAVNLEVGTDIQAWDADLDILAGITLSANATSLISAANYAAMRTLLDLEAGTDFYSISAADAAFQPLEATLTDIADGTITENLVNTTNPWADNEVADDITATNYVLISSIDDIPANDADVPASSKWLYDNIGTAISANMKALIGAVDYAAARGLLDLEAGTDFYSISAADTAFEAELDNSAGLLNALSDETGTEYSVFSDSPAFTTQISIGGNAITTAIAGYLDFTSSGQAQLDARCLESEFGDAIEADDFELSGTTLQLVAEILHSDAVGNISGNWEVQDDTNFSFGGDDDASIAFDSTDARLELRDSSDVPKIWFDLANNSIGVASTTSPSTSWYDSDAAGAERADELAGRTGANFTVTTEDSEVSDLLDYAFPASDAGTETLVKQFDGSNNKWTTDFLFESQFSAVKIVAKTYSNNDDDDETIGTDLTGGVIAVSGDNDTDNDSIDLQDGTAAFDGVFLTFRTVASVDSDDTFTVDAETDSTCSGCPDSGIFTADGLGETVTFQWDNTQSSWYFVGRYGFDQ